MYRNLYRRPQRVNGPFFSAYYPFLRSGDPKPEDRFGWPIDALSDHTILDWHNNDGLIPHVGPQLTQQGTIDFDHPMPSVDINGNAHKAAHFNNAGLLKATSGIPTIAATDDFYLAMLIRFGDASFESVTIRNLFNMGGSTADNWDIRANNNTLNLVLRGDTTEQTWLGSGYVDNNSFSIVQVSIDKDANAYYFINSFWKLLTAPAGSIYNNTGFSISGLHNSFIDLSDAYMSRVYLAAGPGIADICQANSLEFMKQVFYSVSGLLNVKGERCDFDRNELSSQIYSNKLYFYGFDMPIVRPEIGLSIEPAITQKCYKNYNQTTASNGFAATGGTLGTVDRAADLAAATVDVSVLGPRVVQLNNTSGATQYLTSGAATGNTNKHSISAYCRQITGTGARIGLLHTGGTVFQDLGALPTSANWERIEINGITPAASDAVFAIEIPNGEAIHITGQQNEEFSYVTAFLPNELTAATVLRTTDDLDTNQIIDNNKGGIEFDYRSKYTGTVNSLAKIITPSSTGTRFFFIYNYTVRSTDGTTVMIHPVDICDKNWHHVKISWDSSTSERRIQVDGQLTTGPYDGAWSGASETYTIGGDTGFCEIKNFRVLRG